MSFPSCEALTSNLWRQTTIKQGAHTVEQKKKISVYGDCICALTNNETTQLLCCRVPKKPKKRIPKIPPNSVQYSDQASYSFLPPRRHFFPSLHISQPLMSTSLYLMASTLILLLIQKTTQTEEKKPDWVGKAWERMAGGILRRADWVRGDGAGSSFMSASRRNSWSHSPLALSSVFSSLRRQEVVCMWCATIKS